MNHHHRSAQLWHVFSRDFTVYLHTHTFILNRNEPYLLLPSQPQLVLIYRPWRDGRLSRPYSYIWVKLWFLSRKLHRINSERLLPRPGGVMVNACAMAYRTDCSARPMRSLPLRERIKYRASHCRQATNSARILSVFFDITFIHIQITCAVHKTRKPDKAPRWIVKTDNGNKKNSATMLKLLHEYAKRRMWHKECDKLQHFNNSFYTHST